MMIADALKDYGIEEQKALRMEAYANKLLEANQFMNLTRITDPKEVAEKHFIDSIIPWKFGLIKPGDKVVDVGTGAGFPGVPLAIMEPEARFLLVDSVHKKLQFVHKSVDNMCLNVDILWARAEEAAHNEKYREKFDVCVTRAVAYLPKLLELVSGFVRVGGKIVAYKGADIMEELENSSRAMNELCLKLVDIYDIDIVDNSHKIAVFEKTDILGEKYPRKYGKIKSAPLG